MCFLSDFQVKIRCSDGIKCMYVPYTVGPRSVPLCIQADSKQSGYSRDKFAVI